MPVNHTLPPPPPPALLTHPHTWRHLLARLLLVMLVVVHHVTNSYVVKMHNVHQLCESKEVFTFVHPNTDEPIDNRRYTSVEFEITENAVIHGLAGFFDATLYGDVHISIDQRNFSEGMFSWFPLFFPLRWPASVSAGDKINVHMWRQVALHKGRVW